MEWLVLSGLWRERETEREKRQGVEGKGVLGKEDWRQNVNDKRQVILSTFFFLFLRCGIYLVIM